MPSKSKKQLERENTRLKTRLETTRRDLAARDETIITQKAWISRSGGLITRLRDEVVLLTKELEDALKASPGTE